MMDTINKDLREFQLTELELLKKILNVLDKYEITYYALGGTLLGAVRHGGFIPWDDDIDIGIPRSDYEKLLKICEKKDSNIKLRNFKNEKDYIRYFSRLEDSSIKIERHDKMITEIANAWIDIFPLDGMPNNAFVRKIWKLVILYQRAMYRFSCFDVAVDINKENRPFYEKVLVKLGLIIKPQRFMNPKSRLYKLDRVLKKFPYEESKYLVNAMGAHKFKEMFPKSVYGNGQYYQFEDILIFGPEDYNYVCTQMYGNYMLPPNDNEKNHHGSSLIQK